MISFISLKCKKIEKRKKKAGEGGAGAAALTDSGRKHVSPPLIAQFLPLFSVAIREKKKIAGKKEKKSNDAEESD